VCKEKNINSSDINRTEALFQWLHHFRSSFERQNTKSCKILIKSLINYRYGTTMAEPKITCSLNSWRHSTAWLVYRIIWFVWKAYDSKMNYSYSFMLIHQRLVVRSFGFPLQLINITKKISKHDREVVKWEKSESYIYTKRGEVKQIKNVWIEITLE